MKEQKRSGRRLPFLATLIQLISAMKVLFKQFFTIFVVYQPDAEVVCISTGPEATVATHQIEAIPIAETFFKSSPPRNPLLRIVRRLFIGIPSEFKRWIDGLMRLRRTDMLIIPGTGLLTDAYGLKGWGPYNMFKWSLIAKALPLQIALCKRWSRSHL